MFPRAPPMCVPAAMPTPHVHPSHTALRTLHARARHLAWGAAELPRRLIRVLVSTSNQVSDLVDLG